MNNTNRALNRIVILVIGALLLGVGIVVAGASAFAPWARVWKDTAERFDHALSDAAGAPMLGANGRTWILLGIVAVSVVVILTMIVFIFRQGHGQTHTLVTTRARPSSPASRGAGSLVISSTVAEQLIAAALEDLPGVLTANVSTYTVRRQPVLKVTVNARRGASPKELHNLVDKVIAAWDASFGAVIPVFVNINAGIATRVGKPTRLPADSRA